MSRSEVTIVAVAVVAFLAERGSSVLVSMQHPLAVADVPNERSMHVRPTPRTGGVAVHAALLLSIGGWLLVQDSVLCDCVVDSADRRVAWWTWGGTLLIALLSLLDDLRGVGVLPRLLAHTALAGGLVSGVGLSVTHMAFPTGAVMTLGAAAAPVTVLGIVWMANLYNFMDGLDGLAGGMAVIGFGALSLMSWIGGAQVLAGIAALISASAAGFLRHNFPPAQIFMGDVGAVPLGFLAGVLAAWGIRRGAFTVWEPLMVFSPFILDATVTLIRRTMRGEVPWQAHRTHFYQRIALAGWGHRRTTQWAYVLMTIGALCAVAYQHETGYIRLMIVGAWLIVFVGAGVFVDRHTGGVRVHGLRS